MSAREDRLTPLLRASLPASFAFAERDWELLIRQAGSANLLGHLASRFSDEQRLDAVLPAARLHFEEALKVCIAQSRAVRWEAREITRALAVLDGPVVVLKGGAYLLAELPAARGRLFSDIDLLVPRELMADAEGLLQLAGWVSGNTDEYDQRYYRQWMHEIPPMQHAKRETVIDLHHNILPLTSRVKIDARQLLSCIQPIPAWPGLFRLGNADMVLHSAAHLFMDGEFDKGLRDLVDLDALLKHFSQDPAFWPELLARARALGLQRILFYALRYAAKVLQTPVPKLVTAELAISGPNPMQLRLMDAVFLRALRPDHASCDDGLSRWARGFLYLRAHWMRMPLHMLVVHLSTKAFRREPDEAKPATDAAA